MKYSHKHPPFWLDDISVLYDTDNLMEILPRKHFDLNRTLNAILRFSIYYACLVYLFNQNQSVFCIPLITVIVTIALYKINSNGSTSDENESDGINETSLDVKDTIHIDEKGKKTVESCNLPTKDNPFMNLNMYDIGNKDSYGACPTYNNTKLQKKIDKLFEESMFMDTNDIFKHNNSQNRFYTMPNTQPANDTDSFMKWLYLTPPTCKQNNPYACLDSLGRGGNKTPGTGSGQSVSS